MTRTILFLLAIALLAIPSQVLAGRVVVFGDSWGVPAAPALQQVFDSNGHSVTVVGAAVGGETAANLSSLSPSGLPHITDTLSANPDADLVHLSISGNDFLGGWNASLPPATVDSLLESIVDDVETIVQHILSHSADIEVFVSGYDYIRPIGLLGTPLEVNTAMDDLVGRIETRMAGTSRATVGVSHGLMQVVYGQSEFGLLPGDPSLPDVNLPGPPEAFADIIHLTPAGYLVLAEDQYNMFYQQQLAPGPIPGDGNGDGSVDGLDYILWAGNFGTHPGSDGDISDGDYNDDGSVDGLDYLLWAENFGSAAATSVPEPTSLTTALLALVGLLVVSGRGREKGVRNLFPSRKARRDPLAGNSHPDAHSTPLD